MLNGTLIGICWLILLAYWLISAFFVKRTIERQSVTSRMLMLAVCALVYVLLRATLWLPGGKAVLVPSTAVGMIIADAVCAAGTALCLWARIILGRNWSSWVTFKENHELIHTGPYRFVRHPIYSGILLMIFATALFIGRLQGFMAFLAVFAGLWIKLRQEEALMLKHFGPAYAAYKAQTKALIPGVL